MGRRGPIRLKRPWNELSVDEKVDVFMSAAVRNNFRASLEDPVYCRRCGAPWLLHLGWRCMPDGSMRRPAGWGRRRPRRRRGPGPTRSKPSERRGPP